MAKKNKVVKVTGPVQWAKVFEENRDMSGWDGSAASEWGGTYTLDIILSPEEEKKLKQAGSARKIKDRKDSDIEVEGNKYSFSRKHEGPFEKVSGPPKVVKADGTAWDFDEDGYIGNESICELTLSVYPTKARDKSGNVIEGKAGINGTRLDKVKVLKLETYERQDEGDEEGENDEIPF